MLDPFDFKEPACSVCGGKEFYYPDKNAPIGRIDVKRIIERVDACFEKNDLSEAKRLLEYWKNEAEALRDKEGKLAILSELIGLYRKTQEKELALSCVEEAVNLCKKLDNTDTVSGATILLNSATTLKAFGKAEEGMPLYRQAESVYNKRLSPNDAKFGGLYNNMALALVDIGEYDQAISYYKKAIEIMGKQESGQLEVAITQVNLAHLYYNIDKKEDADTCIKKAIELLNDESLIHDGYYAFVCEKCAPSIESFGYVKQAEILQKRSKEIYERA